MQHLCFSKEQRADKHHTLRGKQCTWERGMAGDQTCCFGSAGVLADDGHRGKQGDQDNVKHAAHDQVRQVEVKLVPEVVPALAHLRHRRAASIYRHLRKNLR